MQNVDLKREIKNKTDEIATLKTEITTLEAQNGDMRANINRQERFVNALQIYSSRGNFDKISQLIGLAASGQDEDMDKELDECIRRLRTAKMVQ